MIRASAWRYHNCFTRAIKKQADMCEVWNYLVLLSHWNKAKNVSAIFPKYCEEIWVPFFARDLLSFCLIYLQPWRMWQAFRTSFPCHCSYLFCEVVYWTLYFIVAFIKLCGFQLSYDFFQSLNDHHIFLLTYFSGISEIILLFALNTTPYSAESLKTDKRAGNTLSHPSLSNSLNYFMQDLSSSIVCLLS